MLPEPAPFIDASVEDVGLHLVGRLPPADGPLRVAPFVGQVRTPIGGDPAQDLRRGEQLRLAPDLPDPLVGVVTVLDGGIHEPGQAFPHRLDDGLRLALVKLGVNRIEEHAPYVILVLVPGPVADPDGTRSAVAGEVVECPLGQVPFAADPVHDLELEGVVEVAPGHRLEHEAEILERFPGEAQPVEGAEHERRVPDPGVAVVPVTCPARSLRQRGGRRRHDRAGRRVAEALQSERAPLDVVTPRMVWEGAGAQPVPPVLHRGRQVVQRLLGGRRRRIPPRQGDETGLSGVEGGPPVAAFAHQADAHAAHHGQVALIVVATNGHRVVALAVVVPFAERRSVVEQRQAVDQDLDPTGDAGGDAHQRSCAGRVGRRPSVIRASLILPHGSHGEEVLYRQPPRRGVPGRLEHHGSRHIPALMGDLGAGRAKAK